MASTQEPSVSLEGTVIERVMRAMEDLDPEQTGYVPTEEVQCVLREQEVGDDTIALVLSGPHVADGHVLYEEWVKWLYEEKDAEAAFQTPSGGGEADAPKAEASFHTPCGGEGEPVREASGWYPGKYLKKAVAKRREEALIVRGPPEMAEPKLGIPFNSISCQFECADGRFPPAPLDGILDPDSFAAILDAINGDVLEPLVKQWGTTLARKVGTKAGVIGIKLMLPIQPPIKIGHTVFTAVRDHKRWVADWASVEPGLAQYLDAVSELLERVTIKLGTIGKAKALVLTWPDDLKGPVSLPAKADA
jgi:hypothetical protein